MKLVFLLEEPSMKYLLDELLPKILPEGVEFQTISHTGKRALERSIPRKLRGWNEPGDVRFVILHDQEGLPGAQAVPPCPLPGYRAAGACADCLPGNGGLVFWRQRGPGACL